MHILLVIVFTALSALADGNLDGCKELEFPWPTGRALAGYPARSVTAQKPTAKDYAQSIRENNYQILTDLPVVETQLVGPGQGGTFMEPRRNAVGAWYWQGVRLPSDVEARLETLYLKGAQALGTFALRRVEVRLGYHPPERTETFHADTGDAFNYVVIDSWGGPKTFVQSREGHIFQVEANEAVVLLMGERKGGLHAFPDNGEPTNRRVFVRMGFKLFEAK